MGREAIPKIRASDESSSEQIRTAIDLVKQAGEELGLNLVFEIQPDDWDLFWAIRALRKFRREWPKIIVPSEGQSFSERYLKIPKALALVKQAGKVLGLGE